MNIWSNILHLECSKIEHTYSAYFLYGFISVP